MTSKTTSDLKTDIDTRFPDNTTRLINPTVTRAELYDIADSLVNKEDTTPQSINSDLDIGGELTVGGENITNQIGERLPGIAPAIDDAGVGWRDNIVDIVVKGSGSKSPSWTVIRNQIFGYEFLGNGLMQEFWVKFHIDHDYKMGTPIYPHVHYCTGNTTATGNVKWFFEYTIAKGHQQGTDSVFAATTTVSQVTAMSGIAYHHCVTEYTTGITDPKIEPDSIIMIRIYRDSSDAQDTYNNSVWAICADLHYKFDRYGTLNKSPNFYA